MQQSAGQRWAKKINCQLHYFGSWSDPVASTENYQRQRQDLYAERTPRAASGGLTIRELANQFLTAMRHQLDTREMSQRSFEDYHSTCERVVEAFGRERARDRPGSRRF